MVTVQLASALTHLHLHHQVAHCDLKPANILCKSKDVHELGCVKLADFGFCQRFRTHKEAEFTMNCGTLDYFSPELCANLQQTKAGDSLVDAQYGAAVDCWAFGCIVYELL
jgi:serine/threonine protein kinase